MYLNDIFAFKLYYLAIIIFVAVIYSNYIRKLLYINNLYYIIIKYAFKEYTFKKPSAEHYKNEKLAKELKKRGDDALERKNADEITSIIYQLYDQLINKTNEEPLEGTGLAPYVVATVHTASILRAPDPESREAEGRLFVQDLKVVKDLLDSV